MSSASKKKVPKPSRTETELCQAIAQWGLEICHEFPDPVERFPFEKRLMKAVKNYKTLLLRRGSPLYDHL